MATSVPDGPAAGAPPAHWVISLLTDVYRVGEARLHVTLRGGTVHSGRVTVDYPPSRWFHSVITLTDVNYQRGRRTYICATDITAIEVIPE